MPRIHEMYESEMDVTQVFSSKKSKEFVEITMLHEELERKKERLFLELNEEEKKEAFHALKQKYNIPEYIMVKDAAEILGISPQMVRRHCAEGKLRAYQTLAGSGKWRIEAAQFIGYPDWDKFIEKRSKIKEQSIKIADKMLEFLDDEE